jgi:TPR repeat protein
MLCLICTLICIFFVACSNETKSPIETLTQQAKQGSAGAQFSLGGCYATGNGVPKNDIEAAKWFRKAAEQGDVKAQFILGLFYENGDGVVADYEEAAKWYRKAAEQGHAEAARNYRKLTTGEE